MEKLKVALLAASMPNFSDVGVRLFRQYGQELQGVSEELGFDLRVERDIISTEGKAKEVRKDIDRNCTDFVLLFHPAYILGDIAFELMKSRANFGLWAIEEPAKDGPLPLASLVCLNQNTSIAGHYFRGNRKKFKWFFGNVYHRYFKKRFEITIKALTAVKNLRDAKVAQIGKIADGFRNMYYDERSIYANFGVDVIRGIEIEDVLAEAGLIDDFLVKDEVKRIYSSSAVEVADEKIISSVRNYLAVKKICEENNFKAVAFSCWPKLGKINLTGCLTVSLLDSIGIPAGCEGDMLSTLSMLILHDLSDMSSAVMDLPVFDDEDDSILLWHCGAAPFEMSNERGVLCRCHYRAEFAQEQEFDKLGPVTDIVFPESEVTVFRLTGESNYFYYFTGKILDRDKVSFDGSRGWVGELRLYDRPIKPVDLMNTIFNNSIQHHFPVVFKNVGDYIEEFGYWLGLHKVERDDYRDYLSV
jgi:L-fucose isomerase-like protein